MVIIQLDSEQLDNLIQNSVAKALRGLQTLQPHPAEQEPAERLMTVQETAEFLNLTVPTIYTKVSRGELPYMKQGKRLYFSSLELMEYLKQGRNKTNYEIEEEAEQRLLSIKKGVKHGK